MCTILFSYEQDQELPLILLANRDEFYDRPTEAAQRWEDHPEIFAGRDLVGGGTWLGISGRGRIAAVTNFRDPAQPGGELSRGGLVSDFLVSKLGTREYMSEVRSRAGRYTGFNLIAGIFGYGTSELFYYSNRGDRIVRLEPGLYGLSNHLLDTPWPKVRRGKEKLSGILEKEAINKEGFFEILEDRTLADDRELPDTGIGYEKEKLLSAIFIETPVYGTRSSSVVTADRKGSLDLEERVFV